MTTIKIQNDQFNPVHTFENGQCFRWDKVGEVYVGVINNALVTVTDDKDGHYQVRCVSGTISKADLEYYFDITTNYGEIEAKLKKHDRWLEAALKEIKGLRLLRQAPFEMLISFIVSSNNNIPKIKMTIEDLCRRFGAYVGTYEGKDYYAFPTIDALKGVSEASLKEVKAIGYRAKSIHRTVEKLTVEAIDLSVPYELTVEDGVKWLTQFYGVGEKVAHCILLFGYYKTDAYPVDTWVKKMLNQLYGVEDKKGAYQAFIKSYFTIYSGYAQQILFYYMRSFYNGQH